MSKKKSETASEPAPVCRVCGEGPTIKSHLIPESFIKQIQVAPKSGEQHMIVQADGGPKQPSKTGRFATDILCAACDGRLGTYENEALKLFKRLRTTKIGKKTGTDSLIREGDYPFRVRDTDNFIRFACGILWKYAAISETSIEHIKIGPYRGIFEAICFHNGDVPQDVDVAIERDMTSFAAFNPPGGVYYYRTPSTGVRAGRRVAWFCVEGFTVWVRFDNSGPAEHLPRRCWMRGKKQHHFHVSLDSIDANLDIFPSIKRIESDLAKLNGKALARLKQ